jgi:uncharacterized membrane-anchored protein
MKKNDHPSLAAIVLIATLAFTTSARAQGQTRTEAGTPTTAAEEAVASEIRQMTWFKDTTVTLPESHAKLVLPNGHIAVLGQDAKRLDQINNGTSEKSFDEAEVLSSDFQYHTAFAFSPSGYVDESDWNTLDPTALLKSIIDATEEANKERHATGVAEVHVVKWLHEPTLDQSTHTVYWTIEATESGTDTVNAVAIRLGRTGFEKFTFITSLNNYQPVGGPLDLMLREFSFPPGSTYQEHISTDKAAGYGIAALVGAVVGAKAVKVAAAGGLALFFKPIMAFLAVLAGKAWALLLLPLIWLRSWFRRRPKTPQSADETPPIPTHDPPKPETRPTAHDHDEAA